VDIKVFGTAEPAIGIVAASIPVLRAFIRKETPLRSDSLSFVHVSQIPEPTSRSFNPTKRVSDEVLMTHASTESQVEMGGQRVMAADFPLR
jgi:hypothetical protein